MLPVFTVYRSGNLTEEKFHQFYGDLLMGFTIKRVVVYVGIGLGAVSLVVFIAVTLKMIRDKKTKQSEKQY
jgi:hypothetical protein